MEIIYGIYKHQDTLNTQFHNLPLSPSCWAKIPKDDAHLFKLFKEDNYLYEFVPLLSCYRIVFVFLVFINEQEKFFLFFFFSKIFSFSAFFGLSFLLIVLKKN